VPVRNVALKSNTPVSKSVVISIRPATEDPSEHDPSNSKEKNGD